MVSVCFYFQVHQPFRLRKFRIFDIGKDISYFDDEQNKQILNKIANKCYLPTTELLLKLLKHYDRFKVSFSLSGVVLEQFQSYAPELIERFRELLKTGKVELISETYYHSLSFIYSKPEFIRQIYLHKKLIKELFGVEAKVFRNTELIYNDELANLISSLGYIGLMAEGADKVLGWRSPNFVYNPPRLQKLKLLLKNYRLSDDIAFRFSNRCWKEFPLTSSKFASWINQINGNGELVNLFMDFETFGEHQWKETGIFEFLEALPGEILKHHDNTFVTPSEAIRRFPSKGVFSSKEIVSWADVERDISAWVGNNLQKSAVEYLYEIENEVLSTKDNKIIEDWRKLQTSDHFYYMCTKWFNDGDVHKYFNPYDSPYDAYINFMNILNDLILRVEKANRKKISSPKATEFKLNITKRGEIYG